MTDIQVFNNPEFGSIRSVEQNGEPWFVGKDVAEALGYAKPENALAAHVDAPDKTTTLIQGDGSNYKSMTTIINESGLYSLIFSSKLEGAQRFKRWSPPRCCPASANMAHTSPDREQLTNEELLAKALVVTHRILEERDARLAAQDARISELTVANQIAAPKAEYFDELVDRRLLTSFRDTSKQLEVGEKVFIGFLLEHKYIYRDKKGHLMPYADKNDGLFEVKEGVNRKTAWAGTRRSSHPRPRDLPVDAA